MKVILAGGGTGGHLYPGIAVAESLTAKGIEFLFMVSDRGIEKKILDQTDYRYIEQHVVGFAGVSLINKTKSLFKLFSAIILARKVMEKGDKVLLLGGFASAPVAVAAILKGLDIYIHEQNSVSGLVNKLMGKMAKKFFISYPDSVDVPKESVLVGNPVRKVFLNQRVKEINGKNILVLGGSGGSRMINKTVVMVVKEAVDKGYTITHQTGDKLYNESLELYQTLYGGVPSGVSVVPYITDMVAAYASADMVVARSGSGVVFETTCCRRPALYIPFAKAAGDHQYYNAMSMVNKGYARLLQENGMDKEIFWAGIECVFNDIESIKEKLSLFQPMNSAELIVQHMGL